MLTLLICLLSVSMFVNMSDGGTVRKDGFFGTEGKYGDCNLPMGHITRAKGKEAEIWLGIFGYVIS